MFYHLCGNRECISTLEGRSPLKLRKTTCHLNYTTLAQKTVLVLESTYGDRFHGDRTQRIEQLGKILSQALSDMARSIFPHLPWGGLRN